MIPKIFFTYWHTLILPEFIKACMNTWRIYNPDFEIIMYDDNKFKKEFLDIPSQYDRLTHQHRANYVRFCLLEKYGGIWLDCSIILFGSLSESYCDINYVHGFSGTMSHVYFENWFIAAPKNNVLISKWKQEYVKALDMGFDNYKDYYIKKIDELDIDTIQRDELRKINNLLPNLTAYACYKSVCLFENVDEAKVLDAGQGPYHYLCMKYWIYDIAINTLFSSNYSIDELNSPIIKMTRFTRPLIMNRINQKCHIENGSVIDRFIMPYYRKIIIIKMHSPTDAMIDKLIDLHKKYHDKHIIISLHLSVNDYKITNDRDCFGFDLKKYDNKISFFSELPKLVSCEGCICFVEYQNIYYCKKLSYDETKKNTTESFGRILCVLDNNILKIMSLFEDVYIYTNESLVNNNNNKNILENKDKILDEISIKNYDKSIDLAIMEKSKCEVEQIWIIDENDITS